MKYRFSVEVDLPAVNLTHEQTAQLLERSIGTGFELFGHKLGETVHVSLEKMRARSIDLDKPVEQQE